MKQALVSLLILFSSAAAFAQRPNLSSIQIGAHLGVNSSILRGEATYGNYYLGFKSPKISIAGAATASLLWDDLYGIELEVGYSSQGLTYSGLIGPPLEKRNYEKTVSLTYINVPITYKRYFVLNAYNTKSPLIFMNLGFQASFLLDASLQYTIDGTSVTFLEANAENDNIDDLYLPASDKEFFLPFDVATVLAAGVEYPLTSTLSLYLQGRTTLGFKDITAHEFRYTHPDEDYIPTKNFVLSLRAGAVMYF